MMVVQLGDVHIFSCPSQLERVVGMQVTAEQAQEAAQSIDIYNSKEARWYAATMSKQMQCVMSLLGDEVVSNRLVACYCLMLDHLPPSLLWLLRSCGHKPTHP